MIIAVTDVTLIWMIIFFFDFGFSFFVFFRIFFFCCYSNSFSFVFSFSRILYVYLVSAGRAGVCLLNDGSEGQRADWILRVAVGKEIQYR